MEGDVDGDARRLDTQDKSASSASEAVAVGEARGRACGAVFFASSPRCVGDTGVPSFPCGNPLKGGGEASEMGWGMSFRASWE